MAELAILLGRSGVWIDQLTTLDPHPVDRIDLLLRGQTITGTPDPEIRITRNVIFADNYWRTKGAWPDGKDLAGALPVPLNGIVTGQGEPCDGGWGNGTAHEQVHTYYHGTIDTLEDCVDGVAVQETWYASGSRAVSGYYYSRLGGGAGRRFEEALLGLSYEHDGVILLGNGGPLVNREPVAKSGPQWANLHSIFLTNPKSQHQIGESLNFTFRYQDRDSGATVEWYLDTDTNPYNAPAATFAATPPLSANSDEVLPGNASLSTSGVTPGTYRCYAKITSLNGGEPRYEYATNLIVLTTAPVTSDPPAITTVTPNSLPGLPLPQTQLLTLTGTGFLPESRLEFHDGTTPYPNRTPIYISPTELRYNIKVGNVSANWTVKVRNGSHESNPGSFTVTATADSTPPPSPISPVGYFAGGVNDDFYYVDWTDPADASGLAKVWWKLNAPPASPADGVGFNLPLFKPLPVSTLTTNPQTLYLWLEDGAGNNDHNQRASILLFRDTGAPFIVTPPPDCAVIEGASAVFSVVAGGAAPLAYQWQRNGSGNNPGATLSTYATPPVMLADNNAQFRVIITNTFGAVTSSWATLTVNAANTITWTGAVSSDWNNPTNWSPQTVPTASDRVVIDSGVVNVPSSAGFAVMNLIGGIVVFVDWGEFGSFTVVGTINWTSGNLFWWGGATDYLAVASGAVLNIGGSGNKTMSTVINQGIINWTGSGTLSIFPAVASFGIQNLSSGVFNAYGPITLDWGGGVTNSGTINWSGGTVKEALNKAWISNGRWC